MYVHNGDTIWNIFSPCKTPNTARVLVMPLIYKLANDKLKTIMFETVFNWSVIRIAVSISKLAV